MQVKAKAKYIRMSPRKVRLVANLVRRLDVTKALAELTLLKKKAVVPVMKLVNSAVAGAEHNDELSKSNLFIKEIRVEDGPILYRWMPRAHGRATPLRRRTSHIYIVLEERIPTTKKTVKKQKMAKADVVEEKSGDEPVEKLEKSSKKNAGVEAEIVPPVDNKKKVGFRDMQPHDKPGKKGKGIFKKMFQRKAGM